MPSKPGIAAYTQRYGHPPRCEGFFEDGSQCDNEATTVDHFTPKTIAKDVLGWSDQQINAAANKQYLCRRCHRRKDYDTPFRKRVLQGQIAGRQSVGFGAHNYAMNKAYEEEIQEQRDGYVRRKLAEKMEKQEETHRRWRLRFRRAS